MPAHGLSKMPISFCTNTLLRLPTEVGFGEYKVALRSKPQSSQTVRNPDEDACGWETSEAAPEYLKHQVQGLMAQVVRSVKPV